MKIIKKSNKLIIYLNKSNQAQIEKLKQNSEEYIKQIFIKLNQEYNIELTGYYNVAIYHDNNYGHIIEIEKEQLEYFECLSTTHINTQIINDIFLYNVPNLYEIMHKEFTIYHLKDKLYIKPKKKLTTYQVSQILELSNKIIYGATAKQIIKKAKVIT